MNTIKFVPLPDVLADVVMSYFEAQNPFDIGLAGLWEKCMSTYNRSFVIAGACRGGHLLLATNLMGKCTSRDFNYWLRESCYGGNLDLIEFVLRNGATNYLAGINGACYGGHLNVVKYLIESFGPCNCNSSLYVACEHGHLNIVKYLLDGEYADDISRGLDGARNAGHEHIVSYLLNLAI